MECLKVLSSGTTNASSKASKRQKDVVWKWFLKLSLEEKANVLLWEDKHGAELLKQLYKKKWQNGNGFFSDGMRVDCCVAWFCSIAF